MTGSTHSLGRVKIPAYCLHKSSGHARVVIAGKEIWLGKYGTDESRLKYGQAIAQFIAGVAIDPFAAPTENDAGITIAELVLAYLRHAETYYVKNGKMTDEVACIKSAMKPLVDLYGLTEADAFGPVMLKAVRQKMVDSKTKCRDYINKSVSRIRRCFRWAVENELLEPTVLQKLEAVAPLLAGRTEAKDHAPRKAVPIENIEAVKAKVKPRIRDMMDLMLLCGARPGEIVKLTGAMIDRTRDVWTAVFADHKMAHKGKQRTLKFGARSQAILIRYLKADPSKRLFPIRRATLSNAIKKACEQLGIQKYTSHWLRHTYATRIRESHGLDAVQTMLGHSHADTSQIYAHLNDDKADQVARDAG